jgi:hypothetical protein
MDALYYSAGVSFWVGFSGPLYGHVVFVTLNRPNSSREYQLFSRILRFVANPLVIISGLGFAGFFGQSPQLHDVMASSMFLGVAAYALCAWLFYRAGKVNGARVDT